MNFSFLPEYLPYFFNGLKYTLLLSLCAVACAVIPALILALMRLAKSDSSNILLRILAFLCRAISGAYIELFRCTPLLVQIFIVYFGIFTNFIQLPTVYIFGNINIAQFIPGIITLSLNSAAYVAEIIRAGILAVDRGQAEASRSLGMTHLQSMRSVVLPQAIKNILPALANELISMIKESSICMVMGMQDLMWGAKAVAGATYITLEPYYIAAILYFAINFPASKLIAHIERRMRRADKR